MKKLTFLLVSFFALATIAKAQPQQQQTKDITKVLQFKNDNFDFGKIPFGKPTEYTVEVKNISADVVSLDNVAVGCGCTTPKYEKGKKIAPNETYVITLGFNGATNGTFSKVATLYFNDGLTKVVTFKGETFQTPAAPAPANGATEKVKS
ncbi:DUF1573 domain-containing protein [Chitinophagaceae bacterium LWZ2-11]